MPIESSEYDINSSVEFYEEKKLQVFSQVLMVGTGKVVLTTIRDMSHWIELE